MVRKGGTTIAGQTFQGLRQINAHGTGYRSVGALQTPARLQSAAL